MKNKMNRMFQDSSYAVLKSMLGRNLLSIMHEKVELSAKVIRVVQFNLEDGNTCLESDIGVIDYFGFPEDIVSLYMTDGKYQFQDPVLHSHHVGKMIKGISVVNHHSLSRYVPDESEYQYDITTAIILKFDDGSELSFERLDDFIEMIIVSEGKDLIRQLGNPLSYYEDNNPDWQVLESKVEVIELK